MIKLLVTDLDGTLLNEQKKISIENQLSVKAVIDAGLGVCLASARTYREIQHVMGILHGDFLAVSQNGSFIHTSEGILLRESHFAAEVALKICAIAKRHPVAIFVAAADHYIYTPPKTEVYGAIEPRMFVVPKATTDLATAICTGLTVTKFSFYGDMHVLEMLQSILTEMHPPTLSAVISDKDCLDVMPLAVSKGNAVGLLMQHLALAPDEVACIGDSFNDISMFNECSHSFAMESALPTVKGQAAHAADSVAEAIAWIQKYNFQHLKTTRKINAKVG